MKDDPEVAAMLQLSESLTPLDKAAQQRVIEWAMKRYGSATATVVMSDRVTERISSHRPVNATVQTANGADTFADFADLFDAANPKTDHMKALVGGYWLQVCGSAVSFPSRDVNELLKNHGHPVGNITRAFDVLRDSKPAYAAQLEKSGKSKQARKKMKLTTAGIRKMQAMINGEGDQTDG